MALDATDRIGDRLDRPELVPPELQHLIQDDRERVNRILEIEVSGRILDVGCSDGAITHRIANQWRVSALGIDVREYMPEDSQTRYGDGVMWHVAFDQRDIRQAGGPAGMFDAVYACEVLEHMTDEDAQRALVNMLALLRPDGRLIITVPNRHPHDLYEVGCRARWAWPDHRSSWTYRKLQKTLAPYLRDVAFVPIYPDEGPGDSIWLLAHGVKR